MFKDCYFKQNLMRVIFINYGIYKTSEIKQNISYFIA